MLTMVECRHCGTLYSVKEEDRSFSCQKCRKKVSVKTLAPAKSRQISEERLRKVQDRLSRLIFLMGSTVGLFVLMMMVPTAIYFKDHSVLLYLLMLVELVFGTLLVCTSISLYLLSLQVFTLQASMTFHQHNLVIFHDQIAKIFGLIKRKK